MAQLTFEKELESLLNRYSKENDSNTPDFILVKFLERCLDNYNITLQQRDKWFGVDVQNKIIKLKDRLL